MKSLSSYKNSFYSESTPDRKAILSTESQPVAYKGHLIYKRGSIFDIVKDGICIGMRAGINGAKRMIDLNN